MAARARTGKAGWVPEPRRTKEVQTGWLRGLRTLHKLSCRCSPPSSLPTSAKAVLASARVAAATMQSKQPVARRVKDQRLLRLIRRYLEAGVMVEGIVSAHEEGTPQGRPLSPLLSYIWLDELGKELEKRCPRFCRPGKERCGSALGTEVSRVPHGSALPPAPGGGVEFGPAGQGAHLCEDAERTGAFTPEGDRGVERLPSRSWINGSDGGCAASCGDKGRSREPKRGS